MSRDRAEIRKNRIKKIRKRLRLAKDKFHWDDDDIKPGYLTNNNYLNETTYNAKTNTRKAHSNYRRPGGFGEDMKWKPHDQRQIDGMDNQIDEIKDEA